MMDFNVRTHTDPTEQHIKQIVEILKEILDKVEIEWETFTYLKPDMSNNRTANFYFLPKIHKNEVKDRPIINGNRCPTEKNLCLRGSKDLLNYSPHMSKTQPISSENWKKFPKRKD